MTGNDQKFFLHAYGVAIDINLLQNPYIGFSDKNPGDAYILPKNVVYYVNRIFHAPGSAETVVDVFAANDFSEWVEIGVLRLIISVSKCRVLLQKNWLKIIRV